MWSVKRAGLVSIVAAWVASFPACASFIGVRDLQRDETSGDETSGDETSGDETSGDETSGDETSGDETSGERDPGFDGSSSTEGHVTCEERECTPEQTKCDTNNGLQTCDSSGRYGTANLCEDTTCLGEEGSASCRGVCAPGQVQCLGNGVQSCDATTGEYDANITTCKSSAPHCASGSCGQPPSCRNLTTNCGSTADESCCTSLRVTGGTYDRVNDMSYPAMVADFRLDKFEVTVGRWRRFVAAWDDEDSPWRPAPGGGKHEHLNSGRGLVSSYTDGGDETGWNSSWAENVDTSGGARDIGGTFATWTPEVDTNENRPINLVNWYESYAFCIWDGGFLPSEAEWNYAAAGGGENQRPYPWGQTMPDCGLANFLGGSGGVECYDSISTNVGEVTSKGVYGQGDLAGNVWEWNLDWYADTASAFAGPCTNCAYLPSSASNRVIRGGSFGTGASQLATSYRNATPPASRIADIGFRCARAL